MSLEIVSRLQVDYPEFNFVDGKKFTFRPPKTIVSGPKEPHAGLLLLHELGHALSGHKSFDTNVDRLKKEVEAWGVARELADRYGVEFSEEVMQSELDTYRNWLHQKSRCPECGLTRFETPDGQYHCPRCENLT